MISHLQIKAQNSEPEANSKVFQDSLSKLKGCTSEFVSNVDARVLFVEKRMLVNMQS